MNARQELLDRTAFFLDRTREERLQANIESVLDSAAPGLPRPDGGKAYCGCASVENIFGGVIEYECTPWFERIDLPFEADDWGNDLGIARFRNTIRYFDFYGDWVYTPGGEVRRSHTVWNVIGERERAADGRYMFQVARIDWSHEQWRHRLGCTLIR